MSGKAPEGFVFPSKEAEFARSREAEDEYNANPDAFRFAALEPKLSWKDNGHCYSLYIGIEGDDSRGATVVADVSQAKKFIKMWADSEEFRAEMLTRFLCEEDGSLITGFRVGRMT